MGANRGREGQAAVLVELLVAGNRVAHQILVKDIDPLGCRHGLARFDNRTIDGCVLKSRHLFNRCLQVVAPAFSKEETPLRVAALIYCDSFGENTAPGRVLFRLSPAFDERVDVVAWTALDVDEDGVREKGVQVGHTEPVLIVLVDPAVLASPGEEVAGDDVAVLRRGVCRIESVRVPALFVERVQVHPEIVRFALQGAELGGLRERLVNNGCARARASEHDDGTISAVLAQAPSRCT